MVPPDSHRISGVPCYLGIHSRGLHIRLHDSHALWSAFPDRSTSHNLYHSSINQQLDQNAPTTPNMQRLLAITHAGFGLFRFRSPLLTESQLFSLPVGTEMFHFPTFPPTPLYIQGEVAGHNSGIFEVSLFGHPRITARLPAPRGLSQVTTSFIGS